MKQHAQDNMQNQMMMQDSMEMMHQMQLHHTAVFVFDVLVLIGLASVIALLSKILKELRRK